MIKEAIDRAMIRYKCKTVHELSRKLFPDRDKNYLHSKINNERMGHKVTQSTIDILSQAGITIESCEWEVVKTRKYTKKPLPQEFNNVLLFNNVYYIPLTEVLKIKGAA